MTLQRSRQAGFSIIDLMISIVLWLIILAALTSFFVSTSDDIGLAASLRATPCAYALASVGGTTRLTKPQSAAVRASMASPVSSISSARLRESTRLTATIGVEQNKPMRTPGVAKVAASEAMAKSQVATNWQPAAVAMPCTSAMTGCGRD